MTSTTLRHVCSSILAAVVLVLSAVTAAAAQRVTELSTGARIKVVAPEAGVPWAATAIVDSVSRDTLYLRSLSEPPVLRSAARVSVPLTSIRRLAISGGRASRIDRAGRGALWGLAVYTVLASTYIVQRNTTCRRECVDDDGFAWIGLAAGLPWSAGIGAAIGAALPVERWHHVTLDGSR